MRQGKPRMDQRGNAAAENSKSQKPPGGAGRNLCELVRVASWAKFKDAKPLVDGECFGGGGDFFPQRLYFCEGRTSISRQKFKQLAKSLSQRWERYSFGSRATGSC